MAEQILAEERKESEVGELLQGRDNARAVLIAKTAQKLYIIEGTNEEEKVAEVSPFAGEITRKKLPTQNRKFMKEHTAEETQQKLRRRNDPLNAEEDEEGKRKLKGKGQKDKWDLKKKNKAEEREQQQHRRENDALDTEEDEEEKRKMKRKTQKHKCKLKKDAKQEREETEEEKTKDTCKLKKIKNIVEEGEQQQQQRRENGALDMADDEEEQRKLKGKSTQKHKCKVKKNAKLEEKTKEEKLKDTCHGGEHTEEGQKPKENGEQEEDTDALKMGKQKWQMKQASSTRSMFGDAFEERRDLEQYFWSEKTVLQLMQALGPTAWHSEHGHVCCLAAPSLAQAFYTTQGRAEALLDIDKRFEYLPGFRFFDLCNPASSDSDDFRIVVFDPPFFYIPLQTLFQAVLVAVHGNLQAKLLVGFLRREEGAFLQTFSPFQLQRTRFVLEYATVKPNKWHNYALYANIDLPGIKRIR